MVGKNLGENEEFSTHEVVAPSRAELDLFDGNAVARAIQDIRPSFVVHAAGTVGGISANQANQAVFLSENALMGINLVRASAAAGVSRFLNISSSCVYPRDAENPLTETSLFTGCQEPTNEGYALAKLVVLRLGEFLAEQSPEFRWVSLIPCNLFGRWDHFEPGRSHLLPAIIRKLHDARVSGAETVDIWGDGMARREFMLASDLADFVVRAVANFDDLPPRMNIGIGRDYTVREYYEVAADVIGFEGSFTHDLSRATGMRQKLVDNSHQERLGWESLTSLRAGIESTYQFFLEHVS